MIKPVVSFECFHGVTDYPPMRARLSGVTGHPLLGDEPAVTTSRVYRFAYDESGEVIEVETRNTIYRKDTSHDPASYAAATAGQRETGE